VRWTPPVDEPARIATPARGDWLNLQATATTTDARLDADRWLRLAVPIPSVDLDAPNPTPALRPFATNLTVGNVGDAPARTQAWTNTTLAHQPVPTSPREDADHGIRNAGPDGFSRAWTHTRLVPDDAVSFAADWLSPATEGPHPIAGQTRLAASHGVAATADEIVDQRTRTPTPVPTGPLDSLIEPGS